MSFFDLSTLKIDRIIVHDIPKHKKDDLEEEPNYSDDVCDLSNEMKQFFRQKVIQSLGSTRAFRIVYDDDSTSIVKYKLQEIFEANGGNFIENSKSIGRQLFESQMGNNAAGILVCIYAEVHTKKAVIILKLERDTGAQLTTDPITNSFNIEEVKDLMLTQKTKIFKVALLVDRDIHQLDFDGRLMDHQIDVSRKKEVTTWFMEKFLGCLAYDDPRIATKKFHSYTTSFIQGIEDTLTRAKYIMDLNSYLQKNSDTISGREFADEYFVSSEHKDEYDKFMGAKKFGLGSFRKDIGHIKRQIQKVTLQFENDITVIGSKGTFDERVKLSKTDDGQHKAEIVSKIKKIT